MMLMLCATMAGVKVKALFFACHAFFLCVHFFFMAMTGLEQTHSQMKLEQLLCFEVAAQNNAETPQASMQHLIQEETRTARFYYRLVP